MQESLDKPQVVASEEWHAFEADKMLRKPGDVKSVIT
jgi:hypothetical protein